MPTIADYLRLAPYSLDELVGAVNGLLRDHPRLGVTRRTLRYYVAEGAIPAPSGPPKFARYEGDHLLRVVALRAALGSGRTLGEARREAEELLRLPSETAQREIERRLALVGDRTPVSAHSPLLLEEALPSSGIPAPTPSMSEQEFDAGVVLALRKRSRSIATPVLRVPLDEGVVLELPGTEIAPEPLRAAERAIRRLLDSL